MKKQKSVIKRILSCLLSFVLVFSLGISNVYAKGLSNNSEIIKPSCVTSSRESLWIDGASSKNADRDAIEWKYKNSEGKYYLYLPSHIDLNNLVIWHTFKSSVKVNGKTLISGEATDVFSKEGEYKLNVGNTTYTLVIMKSLNVASMFLKTNSKSLSYINQSKSNSDSGSILVVTPEGKVDYDKTFSKLKGRGNSTWDYEKKPYNITLDKKTNLLGMDSSKKWCLLANYRDQSLLRNQIMYDLGNDVGLDYSPNSKPIDLYVNGEYLGTYELCEKVEVGDNNLVKITDLEKATEKVNNEGLDTYSKGGTNYYSKGSYKYVNIPNDPEDITGGYVMEFELVARYADETCGFVSKNGQPVIMKSPEYISKAQSKYISSFYQEFEDALYSSTGYNSQGKHYTDYIDVESFAKMYLIQELSKNLDAAITSFYIYKDSDLTGDGKMHAAPVWDFDVAIGNYKDSSRDPSSPNGWWVRNGYLLDGNYRISSMPTIFNKLFSHSDFEETVTNEWNTNFYDKVKVLFNSTSEGTDRLKTISEYKEMLEASAKMNFKRWGVLGTTTTGIVTGSSYSSNIDFVSNFLKNRSNYLNKQFGLVGEKTTIYFDNSISKWSSVYAYVWTEGSVSPTVLPMNLVEGETNIYSVSVSGEYEQIIFKNTDGVTSWNLQTKDLTIPTGDKNCYKPNGTGTKPSGDWISYAEGTKELTLNKVTTDKNSPQSLGKEITVTAEAFGGEKPYTYEFKVNDQVIETTGNSFKWNPTEIGDYKIAVTVKDKNGDTSTKEIDYTIKEVSKNIATIYYSGFSVAYIHYKVGSGKWTVAPGVLMENSKEIDGYEHKIEIDLEEENILTACFNNGNGSWDNNGNKNYTFEAKTYAVKNGVVREIENPSISIENFNVSKSSPQLVNTKLDLSASVKNAIGNVSYKFYQVKNNVKTLISEGDNKGTWTPEEAGSYTLILEVEDESGKKDSKEILYTINNKLSLESFKADKDSLELGESVNLTASAKDGLKEKTYKFYLEDGTIIQEGNKNTVTWKPENIGNYLVFVDITDENKDKVTDKLSIEVKEPSFKVLSFETDKLSPQETGSKIKISASAIGEGAPYSYNISVVNSENEIVAEGKDNVLEWTGESAGNYTIKLVVKNSLNEEITKEINYVIKDIPKTLTTIYYKKFVNPYIHYKIGNGSWTKVPGVSMKVSTTMPGYYEYTVDLGEETTLTACFNNGSNLWDNNGGKNYTFGLGEYILENGVSTDITERDLEILDFSSSKLNFETLGKTVTLTANASYGKGEYEYKFLAEKDGIETVISDFSSLSSVKWTAKELGKYTLKVIAKDALGNIAEKTMSYEIVEKSLNVVTIYYNKYSTPYIHYKIGNGSWTKAPGIEMTESSTKPGYYEYTIDLGEETTLTACFNNGAGVWDNNGGRNYTFYTGEYILQNGVINKIN